MNAREAATVEWRIDLLVVRAACAVLALMLLPSAARAQSAVPVSAIVVEQEGALVTDPELTGLVESRPGEPVDLRAVRETITHFMSLGRFEDVQVFQDETADGVRLRFVIIPAHPIDRLEFRGALGVPEGDVRRVVTERFGAAPSEARIPEVRKAIEAYYRGHGFTAPRVTSSIAETHNPDRASLIIEIQSGPRVRITAVDVNGLASTERTALLAVVDTRVGAPYDADVIQRGLERYEAGARARGYYEARASHSVRFDADGGARVVIVVERGPLVTVAFAGDALPEGERERLVPIRAEASVDEDLLEDATVAIEEYLRGRGHRDAVVTYTRELSGEQLRLLFTVNQGRRYVIDRVTVEGNQSIPLADVQAALALKPESPFVQESLDVGITALRVLYRSRGFSRPDIRASSTVGAVPAGQDRPIDISITIAEGARTLVGQVTFDGAMVLADAQLRTFVTVAPGRAFTELEVATDRDRLDEEYRNRGYDSVVVVPTVAFRDDNSVADVTFAITEGQQALIDHVIVVGNRHTKRSTIDRELTIRAGDPLRASALVESQQRLAALGLFRRIQVTPVAHPGESRRDVIVQVEEAPATTLGYGGGVEGGLRLRPTGEGGAAEERFELAPRGFFEIGRRNLWGKNRSVNLFGRVSLKSRDVVPLQSSPLPVESSGYGFHEYRLYATYREPKTFSSPVDVLFTGIINQAVRSSFNFITREARAEAIVPVTTRLSLAGRYSFEQTRLFDVQVSPDEKPLIDRLFPQVRLSGFAASLVRDTRDDGLYPTRGTFSVVDSELAARVLGSEVGYVKTFAQLSTFVKLPAQRRVILALAGRVGAAHGFPRTVFVGPSPVGDSETPPQQIVQDLPASKRFFAGGDTTVRGFALDRLGDQSTISPSGFPTGGNGEIILNSELRVGVMRQRAEVVGFVDAGNVFLKPSDLDITNLRSAAGFGFRYRSPVGPIRVDLGFNLKPRELVPGQLERRYVLHISLGQAF